MLFISHRGNLAGPDLNNENKPEYVSTALEKGYSVVVDTWAIAVQEEKNTVQLVLGDLTPQYPVTLEFLQKPNIISRAKNLETFQILLDNNVHTFLDSNDTQLTSRGLIWPRVGARSLVPRAVLNIPELITNNIATVVNVNCSGMCSNFIERVKSTRSQLDEQTRKAAEEQVRLARRASVDQMEAIPEVEEQKQTDPPEPSTSEESTDGGSNVLILEE